MTEDQRQLVRELRSYNYLLHKYADMTEQFAKSLNYIDSKINEIDAKLNEYHIPAVRYDSNADSKNPKQNPKAFKLIYEQEKIIKRKEDIILEQKKSVDRIVSRIEDVDEMLIKLNAWERQFITHMYIESRCIEYMIDSYGYSKTNIYKKANLILKKMLKK